MSNFIQYVSITLSIVASSLLILVISVNLYFRIRRKFPISVNCWFCNAWTKVPYDDQDSFDCPNCLQYNGFTKDGAYNKIIPEQHDEMMNKSTQIKTRKTATTNGLCTLCNNNQQLKVFQLANFVPLVEDNYDLEIEHFQEQLEKAYKLCRKCDKVLKKTIDKQNAWIFGNKIKNMYINGVTTMKTISEQVKKGAKLPLITKINGTVSIVLVFSIIFVTISSITYLTEAAAKYIPTNYLPIFKNAVLIANTSKIIEVNSLDRKFKIQPLICVCCIGIFVQSIGAIWEKYSSTIKVNRLLCWIILLLSSWVRNDRSYATYILLVQVFCCVYLLWTSFNKRQEKVSPQKPSGKVMRKLVKNLEYTCTDFSDTSDFEDVSSSSKHTNSSQESLYSTLTHLPNSVPVQNSNVNTAKGVLSYTDLNKSQNFTDLNKSHIFTDLNKRHYTNLNKSLDNLHLGFKSPVQTFSVTSVPIKRPKPVLSPPKFQTNSSWLAGGFWGHNGVIMPTQRSNMSRSSSESSGFGSQHNENFQFVPSKDFDRSSVNSEFLQVRTSPNPDYLFAPISKPEFFPPLQQNSLLMIDRNFVRNPNFNFGQIRFNEPYQRKGLIENWSDKINSQTVQSFRDLSLHSKWN